MLSRTVACLTVPSYLGLLGTWLTEAAVTSGFLYERMWLLEAVFPYHYTQFHAGEPKGLSGTSAGLMPRKEASDPARKEF